MDSLAPEYVVAMVAIGRSTSGWLGREIWGLGVVSVVLLPWGKLFYIPLIVAFGA